MDTSVVIDHLRGVSAATEAIFDVFARDERIAASVLTRFEVLAGMRTGEEAATQGFLAQFEWISVDSDIATRAGALARRWRASHGGADPVDLLIAATANAVRASLWTRNVGHFPMFEGLEPPY